VVEQKNPDLSQEQKLAVAHAVGIGAIKYPMLARENTKIVTFDWETPWISTDRLPLYSICLCARQQHPAQKRRRCAGRALTPNMKCAVEIELIELISRLPKEVQQAAKEYRPLHIATWPMSWRAPLMIFTINARC
jgi:arginyl-tRNA synthetase